MARWCISGREAKAKSSQTLAIALLILPLMDSRGAAEESQLTPRSPRFRVHPFLCGQAPLAQANALARVFAASFCSFVLWHEARASHEERG